jgi:hypothetical protein
MKIRLNSSSIRFRISSSELTTLSELRSLQENVQMGPGPLDRLSFEVHLTDALEQMSFQHTRGAIRVCVPLVWLPEWHSGKKVGFEMKHGAGNKTLKIIVEKDLE